MNTDGLKWAAPIVAGLCASTVVAVWSFAAKHGGFVGTEEWADKFSDKKRSEARKAILVGVRGIHGSTGDGDDAIQAVGALINGLDQMRWVNAWKSLLSWCKLFAVLSSAVATLLAVASSWFIHMDNDFGSSRRSFVACVVTCAVFAVTASPFVAYKYRSAWSKDGS